MLESPADNAPRRKRNAASARSRAGCSESQSAGRRAALSRAVAARRSPTEQQPRGACRSGRRPDAPPSASLSIERARPRLSIAGAAPDPRAPGARDSRCGRPRDPRAVERPSDRGRPSRPSTHPRATDRGRGRRPHRGRRALRARTLGEILRGVDQLALGGRRRTSPMSTVRPGPLPGGSRSRVAASIAGHSLPCGRLATSSLAGGLRGVACHRYRARKRGGPARSSATDRSGRRVRARPGRGGRPPARARPLRGDRVGQLSVWPSRAAAPLGTRGHERGLQHRTPPTASRAHQSSRSAARRAGSSIDDRGVLRATRSTLATPGNVLRRGLAPTAT